MLQTERPRVLHHIKKGIAESNYALLPFPLSRDHFGAAMQHFFEFLTLPVNLKNRFQSNAVSGDEESFVGYIKRERQKQVDAATSEAFYDQKEYFHYNHYAEKDFKDLLLETEKDARVKNFFNSARFIYKHAEEMAIAILNELDEEHPGIKEKFVPEEVKPHFYLRFLRYYTTGRGNFLAKGHYDQGGFTLALAESAPGLRIGRSEENLEEIVHIDGHVVFMPALQLQLFTSEEFTPAWHDVIQKAGDKTDEETARWAIVFFVDPVNKIRTRWEDRHTPAY